MKSRQLELGAVLKPTWENEAIRVLAYDDRTVMYDAWLADPGEWALRVGGAREVIYYRLDRDFLLANAEYLRTDTYSEEEFSKHRPDLPLALARSEEVQWSDDLPEGDSELAGLLQRRGIPSQELDRRFSCEALVIAPFGRKGGHRAGVTIMAPDGEGFSLVDIVRAAWRIQRPFLSVPPVANGIGIYRSGLKAGRPSFYVWGSRAQHED